MDEGGAGTRIMVDEECSMLTAAIATVCASVYSHLPLSQDISNVSHLCVRHLADGQQMPGAAHSHLQDSPIIH